VFEAEATYKLCVADANNTQHQLIEVKLNLLREIRQLLDASDEQLKAVRINCKAVHIEH